ncbi:MAG TPA: tryptophan synthase subunit beta, partial [bacterium]|nr:tryptophan synthase subunit beta [bacterium]
REIGGASYTAVTDSEALRAFHLLCEKEGIIPALESAHALAWVIKNRRCFRKRDIVIVNLSGRGDKDVAEVAKIEGKE